MLAFNVFLNAVAQVFCALYGSVAAFKKITESLLATNTILSLKSFSNTPLTLVSVAFMAAFTIANVPP
ncbi:hypothetical protein D9M72_257250 [compost metagenome]